jgi:hypothetical protein
VLNLADKRDDPEYVLRCVSVHCQNVITRGRWIVSGRGRSSSEQNCITSLCSTSIFFDTFPGNELETPPELSRRMWPSPVAYQEIGMRWPGLSIDVNVDSILNVLDCCLVDISEPTQEEL